MQEDIDDMVKTNAIITSVVNLENNIGGNHPTSSSASPPRLREENCSTSSTAVPQRLSGYAPLPVIFSQEYHSFKRW